MTSPRTTRTRPREPDPPRKVPGSRRAVGVQFDAGNECAVFVGQIAGRPAKACAEIRHLAARTDQGALRERIDYRQSSVMVLVVREQVLRRERIEITALRRQAREDLVARYRVAAVERQHVIVFDWLSCGMSLSVAVDGPQDSNAPCVTIKDHGRYPIIPQAPSPADKTTLDPERE